VISPIWIGSDKEGIGYILDEKCSIHWDVLAGITMHHPLTQKQLCPDLNLAADDKRFQTIPPSDTHELRCGTSLPAFDSSICQKMKCIIPSAVLKSFADALGASGWK